MSEFSLIILLVSFIAGILTVFAPCVFTFLTVILGTSNILQKKSYKQAIVIISSLAFSVFIFSLLLKASTLLIQIQSVIWDIIAGLIIITQGIFLLFPVLWEKISFKIGLTKSANLLNTENKTKGLLGDIFTGMALGPIFSSCSPTYGFIIGTLLQTTLSFSIIYLIVYILGVAAILFVIAVLGQSIILKLKWGTNPNGIFKKTVAIIFILIGILILTGYYKTVEIFIIENLPFLDVTRIDRTILEDALN